MPVAIIWTDPVRVLPGGLALERNVRRLFFYFP